MIEYTTIRTLRQPQAAMTWLMAIDLALLLWWPPWLVPCLNHSELGAIVAISALAPVVLRLLPAQCAARLPDMYDARGTYRKFFVAMRDLKRNLPLYTY